MKKIVLAFLFSMGVLAVGFLAVLGLTEVFQEPISIITVDVDPVTWQIERPSLGPDQSFSINQTVQNAYADGQISVAFSIRVLHYFEDFSEIPYGQHRDGVDFQINSSINAMQGNVDTVLLKFLLLDSNAEVWVSTVEHLKVHNMTVTATKYFGTDTAYIEAQVLASPSSLKTQVDWVFSDDNSQDHSLRAMIEISYNSPEERQKLVVPIILEVVIPS